MGAIIRTRLEGCAILFAGLMVTAGPAVAKVTIVCKNVVVGTSGYLPAEYFAKKAANNDWNQKVKAKYGAYWAGSGDAANTKFTCWYEYPYGYKCVIWAKPCAPVKPPSASQAQPGVPPNQAATERLPPSNSETRTTAPGGRTSIIDQPSGVMQLPGAGPGQGAPATSPGIGGPRR